MQERKDSGQQEKRSNNSRAEKRSGDERRGGWEGKAILLVVPRSCSWTRARPGKTIREGDTDWGYVGRLSGINRLGKKGQVNQNSLQVLRGSNNVLQDQIVVRVI